jgi:predicted metalloprotease
MTKIRSKDSSMIEDRRGRGGGGGGAGFPGMSGLPAGMKAGGGVLGLIITLAVLFMSGAFSDDGSTSGGTTNAANGLGGGAAAEACTTDLEQTLCGSTIDVQQYWGAALPKYFSTPYQNTRTVFFSGRTNTGCGAATSEVGPFYCPADQLVYFDLDFLVALEQQYIGQSTDLAQQYIVAHEYGHHIQNLLGTSEQVRRLQKSKPSLANQYSVALELQADCYAGVWAHHSQQARNWLDRGDIEAGLNAASQIGDDKMMKRSQGVVVPDAFTHGSSQQRTYWFGTGMKTGDLRSCDTFTQTTP